MIKKVMSWVFVLSFCFTATTMAQPADQKALLGEVLKLGRLEDQIKQIPEMLTMIFQQSQMEPNQETEQMKAAMLNAYNADVIYGSIEGYFLKNFNEEHLTELKGWLKSPLAQRIAELEVKASGPESYDSMVSFAQQLQTNPLPQERLDLLERFDAAVGGTELYIRITVSTFTSMLTSMNNIAPAEQKLNQEQLNQVLQNFTAMTKENAKQSSFLSFAFAYQTLSQEELLEYVQNWEKESGKWFNGVLQEAMAQALSQSAEKVGIAMGNILNKKQNLSPTVQ